MTYNLHPIIVHFPIALLTLYSAIKVLPVRRLLPRIAWRDAERVLLLFGVLGAFAALATGNTAERFLRPSREILDAHSTFAHIATLLYVLLLVGELTAMANARFALSWSAYPRVKKIFLMLETILCHTIFSGILATIAFLALAITGLLGGVMVYGTSADPLAGLVLKVLGITSF